MYTYKAKVTHLVDGDTMDCDIDLGFYMQARIRVRFARIDAPETYGKLKEDAGIITREFVRDQLDACKWEVKISTDKTGKFGRWIAEIWCGDENLNDLLVKNGLAREVTY